MENIIKTYVVKIYSGSYNEIVREEVESRDPTQIKDDGLMLGFYFYDKMFVLNDKKIIEQKEFNRSKFIYCGERLSLEDIKIRCINDSKYGNLESLIRRMEHNGNEFACYTNGGCILVMHKGDMTYDEITAKKKTKSMKMN